MKWGVIGYGRFAPKFLASLGEIKTEQVVALATRSGADRAKEDYPNARIYKDYNEMYMDPEVEIVYVATTHNFHKQHVLHALENGKHVICEKPMGLTSDDATEMIEKAMEKNLFLMEGLWSRYLPAYRKMMHEISEGVIGTPKVFTANFCFEQQFGPERRLLNKDLAGGALYDLGVYPISFALDIFDGLPHRAASVAEMTETGVDGTVHIMMEFENGGVAHLFCSILMSGDQRAIIFGTKGRIEMETFWKMEGYNVIIGEEVREEKVPYVSTGYYHEIQHALECIKNGDISPKLFSHNDSLLNAEIVDEIKDRF